MLIVPALWIGVLGMLSLWFWNQGRLGPAQWSLMSASSGGFFLIWLLALPALRPRVAIPAMVAQVVLERASPGDEVVLARNYQLPSLPLYLMQAGLQVRQQHESETVAEIVSAGVIYVRDGDAAAVDGAVSIDGWIPDRGTPIRFWVSGP